MPPPQPEQVRSFLNYNANIQQLQPTDEDAVILRFREWTVPDLRKWLGLRGVRTNDCSKEEIVQLAYFSWKLQIPFNPTEVERQKEANSRLEEICSIDGVKLPDPTKVTDWSTDLKKLPTILNQDIYEYLINSPGPISATERLRAFRSLNAYNYSLNGWVQTIYLFQATDNLMFVKANVKPSQTSAAPYEAWVIITDEGSIHGARCACMAGLGEACSHIAALLYKACAAAELGYNQPDACTSVANTWNNAFTEKVPPKQLQEIDFSKPRNDEPRRRSKPCRRPSGSSSSSSETDLFDIISESAPQAGILLCLRPKQDIESFAVDAEESNYDLSDADLGVTIPCGIVETLSSALPWSDLFEMVQESVSQEQSDLVFKATLDQNRCNLWKKMRCGRITASNADYVLKFMRSKRKEPSATSIKSIIGTDRFISGAMQWGIDNEPKARQDYIEKMAGNHHNLQVELCGLKILPGKAHIGASPDGLVTCSCCPPRLLEIKCAVAAYEKKLSPKEEGVMPYLHMVNGGLKLRTNHHHFTQVQAQMGVMGISACDFTVWNPLGMHIETIPFQPDLWDDIEDACTQFFIGYILPLLDPGANFDQMTTDQVVPQQPQRPGPSHHNPTGPVLPQKPGPSCPNSNGPVLPQKPGPSKSNSPQLPVPSKPKRLKRLKYPCTVCRKNATTDSVGCDGCDEWTHFKCAGLEGTEASLDSDTWFCLKCSSGT